MNKKIIGGAVVLAVLVLFVVVLVGSKKNTVEYQSLVKEDNAVLITDQKPNDEVVVAKYAKLSKPGYVVMYGQNSTGAKGSVLGVSNYLPAGEHINVPIKRVVNPGSSSSKGKVTVQVVADDGDQIFIPEVDLVVTDENGEAVESDANLDENAEVVDTTDEFVAELEEEGYTVNEEAVDDLTSEQIDEIETGNETNTEDQDTDNSSTTTGEVEPI